MSDMDLEQILLSAWSDGFVFEASPGPAYVVPGRFAYIIIAEGGQRVHGIQWPVFGSKVTMQYAKDYLTRLMNEHSAEKEGSKAQVLESIEAELSKHGA